MGCFESKTAREEAYIERNHIPRDEVRGWLVSVLANAVANCLFWPSGFDSLR